MSFIKEENGAINALLIPLILAVIGFFGAIGFGAWAYSEREDYKNNVDQKVQTAVKIAEDRVSTKKDNEFLEKEKNPLTSYNGPSVYGDINLNFPKTWSVLVNESNNSFELVMNPKVVSADKALNQALRVQVLNTEYDTELKKLDNKVKSGNIKAKAFRLAKIKDVLGTRIDGEVKKGANGSSVYLPLRDKTLIISTESQEYLADFNKIILPNFTFNP